MRALVVEDDSAARRILERALEQRGHHVTSVADAETALDHHRAQPFPLLLVDWHLPGMDGLSLCRHVRAAPGGEDVAIMVVTGSDSGEDLLTALDAGASDYLVKPINVALLRTRLVIAERLARDIAQRRQMQERLLVADRMASLGTLSAGLAHEINNPLAAVVSSLDYVDEQLPLLGTQSDMVPALEDLRGAVRDARAGAERVRLIVRDLRTFSSDRSSAESPVDVRVPMDLAVQLAWNEIWHRARLAKSYQPVPPVRASEAQLTQAFVSLLLNAAQAVPDGSSESHEIAIDVAPSQDGRVRIEVRDTGVGIPADIRTRIFDPFFTTKGVGGGMGLGLSICHGIVTGAGGEIEVDSVPGRGTIFRIYLPAALASETRGTATAPAIAVAPRRSRVLVVDDEPMVLSSIARALGREHEVVTMTSVRDALDAFARGERFDVILCDVMMPTATGDVLYEQLARLAPAQRAHMVFMTGGAFTERARQFLASVDNERIEKPFDVGELRRLVRAVASRA